MAKFARIVGHSLVILPALVMVSACPSFAQVEAAEAVLAATATPPNTAQDAAAAGAEAVGLTLPGKPLEISLEEPAEATPEPAPAEDLIEARNLPAAEAAPEAGTVTADDPAPATRPGEADPAIAGSPSRSALAAEVRAQLNRDSIDNGSPEAAEDDDYVLGPGDVLRFDIYDVPEVTNQSSTNRLVSDNLYNVLVDGTINLPWVGRVPVRGLNLEDAAAVVADRYTAFVVDPVVTLSLFTPRPIRVAVVGEVERPGAYTTAEDGAPAGAATAQNIGNLRTVIQAIQTAGGITQQADIRNITVRRPLGNGSEKVINIDFWALLEDGAQAQNLLLRDGDTVTVPTATAMNAADYQALADANFSPDVIGVDVVGEVDAPGRVEIKPNSSLNQAIMAAGGFDDPRAQTGTVDLIRLNPDGTVSKRGISVNLADGINEETNPALRRNDIVIVNRSGTTQAADFLELIGGAASAIINPILGITSIFNQLDQIGDPNRNN